MYSRYVSYSPPCIAIRIVFVTWCIRSSPNHDTCPPARPVHPCQACPPLPGLPTPAQTCQVSQNFCESPEMAHGLQVSWKRYKISRKLGNLINLIFFCKNTCFWCESERISVWMREMVITGTWNSLPTAPEQRLRRDYVCINSVFGSPDDGSTCGIGSVQWRHHVIMGKPLWLIKTQEISHAQLGSSACWLVVMFELWHG